MDLSPVINGALYGVALGAILFFLFYSLKKARIYDISKIFTPSVTSRLNPAPAVQHSDQNSHSITIVEATADHTTLRVDNVIIIIRRLGNGPQKGAT